MALQVFQPSQHQHHPTQTARIMDVSLGRWGITYVEAPHEKLVQAINNGNCKESEIEIKLYLNN